MIDRSSSNNSADPKCLHANRISSIVSWRLQMKIWWAPRPEHCLQFAGSQIWTFVFVRLHYWTRWGSWSKCLANSPTGTHNPLSTLNAFECQSRVISRSHTLLQPDIIFRRSRALNQMSYSTQWRPWRKSRFLCPSLIQPGVGLVVVVKLIFGNNRTHAGN